MLYRKELVIKNFHLINEVFSKPYNFGREAFARIKTYLKYMLLSTTKDEWDLSSLILVSYKF